MKDEQENTTAGMFLYKEHLTPPDWALREIKGGRLNGKTDINPQWRIQALTEKFGLCGFRWYYTITKQWLEPAANGEVAAFVNIELFVKSGNEWSQPIPGNGGSMFVANEKNGPYVSDEAYKMATTDALSVACKMLGIAGGVYMGTKYQQQEQRAQDQAQQAQQQQQKKPLRLTAEQLAKTLASTDEKAVALVLAKFALDDEEKAKINAHLKTLKKQ